ncbi:hypothetical protein HBF32_03620 [Luteibacter yeojuensis]|uniref:Tail specific protease domain-containing protein n=2 Tax=Luteibacter yeojuensis TaxID=345309 RepID=A0A7X5TPJ7_9GAMM|nr:hypothetical protein [Luteibacter yeojuensis]
MRAYAASFDDGHLRFYVPDKDQPRLPARWPGFLTAFDSKDVQRVVSRADDAPVPLGARLVSCDGKAADRLAADHVGSLVGRWALHSQRVSHGGELFLDHGNPWIARPSRCVFDAAGRSIPVTLDWRPIDNASLVPRLKATYQRAHEPIGIRTWADGTVWIALSDFDGAPGGPAAKALEPLIARLRAERETIVAAPRIVLDLRGNDGGSSDWSRQIAEAIWGEAAVAATDKEDIVDWRASAANIASIREFADELRKTPRSSRRMLQWADVIVAGMEKSVKDGKPYWRAPPDVEAKTSHPALPAPKARIFMVTDSGCGSACLDAADLWLELGAIHVGAETSADTLYMDIRRTVLPSGVGRLNAAMKVYRGRTRGNNVALVPKYPYDGDLVDTGALERWIASLP